MCIASQLFYSFMKSSYLYFSMGQYYMNGDGVLDKWLFSLHTCIVVFYFVFFHCNRYAYDLTTTLLYL